MFKGGTKHSREECSGCGHFFRFAPCRNQSAWQPLPVAPIPARSPAPTPALPAIVSPAGTSTLARALDALDCVHDRSAELREELSSKASDQAQAAALFGAALAALASLSAENVTSLTAAIRAGKLPRRATA